jgi:hypothetical protein
MAGSSAAFVVQHDRTRPGFAEREPRLGSNPGAPRANHPISG